MEASLLAMDVSTDRAGVMVFHPGHVSHPGNCSERCGRLAVLGVQPLAHVLRCPRWARAAGYADTLGRRETVDPLAMTPEAREGWAAGVGEALFLLAVRAGAA